MTETNTNKVRYPDIHVRLTSVDGNAFVIMATITSALRSFGIPETEQQEYIDEAMSGTYDDLLATTMNWVTVE